MNYLQHPKCMLGARKTQYLCDAAHRVNFNQVPGQSAEVGAYQCGGSWIIASILKARKHYVFDTFEGLPSKEISDDSAPGLFSSSLSSCQNLLNPLGNCSIHKGLFEETSSAIADESFAFVHLDCDIYATQLFGLQFFWPRLSVGGEIVIDDFCSPTWTGSERAFDEFVKTIDPSSFNLAKTVQSVEERSYQGILRKLKD